MRFDEAEFNRLFEDDAMHVVFLLRHERDRESEIYLDVKKEYANTHDYFHYDEMLIHELVDDVVPSYVVLGQNRIEEMGLLPLKGVL